MRSDTLLMARRDSGNVALGVETGVQPGGTVSWAAIVAGAVGAAALSLVLLILGTGLGLSAVSPWAGQGSSVGALGTGAILWLAFTQVAAAGMGGYLAGRLRSRWHGVHTDEVYFRDTAHGFLAWALATIVTAALLTSAIGSIVGRGAQAGAALGAGASAGAAAMSATVPRDVDASAGRPYFVDALFRKNSGAGADSNSTSGPLPTSADESARSTTEVARILAGAITSGTLPADDAKYVAQVVAQRTGMPQADAERRVAETFTRMQDAAKRAEVTARDIADQARKTSAYSALWLFISLLVGAFCASLAATLGGRQRDQF